VAAIGAPVGMSLHRIELDGGGRLRARDVRDSQPSAEVVESVYV